MIEKNAKKVKEMDGNALKLIFNDWEQTHQLDPFDIVLYGRYGKPSAIIRRIDGECGVFKPLSVYCRMSTKERVKGSDNVEILNYLDPDGGPLLTPGIYEYTDNSHIVIYEIYVKGSSFIMFYDVFGEHQKLDANTLNDIEEKLRKITSDTKND